MENETLKGRVAELCARHGKEWLADKLGMPGRTRLMTRFANGTSIISLDAAAAVSRLWRADKGIPQAGQMEIDFSAPAAPDVPVPAQAEEKPAEEKPAEKDSVDMVYAPPHYGAGSFRRSPVECIQIARHLPFALGNAVKYVWRCGHKGDKAEALMDLDKAVYYLSDFRSSPTEWLYSRDPFRTARIVWDGVRPEDGNTMSRRKWNCISLILQCRCTTAVMEIERIRELLR